MLSLLDTHKLKGKVYDRDEYDINKAAKDIADKTLKKSTKEKK